MSLQLLETHCSEQALPNHSSQNLLVPCIQILKRQNDKMEGFEIRVKFPCSCDYLKRDEMAIDGNNQQSDLNLSLQLYRML